MLEIPTDSGLQDFESQKQDYFSQIALEERSALRLHKEFGLLRRGASGEREWGNVAEHCLVETARARVFAELLGLNEELSRDVSTGAALHDFFKKQEVAVMGESGPSWYAYDFAQQLGTDELRKADISPRATKLAGAAGHSAVPKTEAILAKPDLEDEDIAHLVIHFIDDYTVGSEWVQPAEINDGKKINDLDRRMDRNEANPRYRSLNQEGKQHFDGATTFEAMRRAGHAAGVKLAELIAERNGLEPLDSLDLPVYIDDILRQKIIAASGVAG